MAYTRKTPAKPRKPRNHSPKKVRAGGPPRRKSTNGRTYIWYINLLYKEVFLCYNK